MSLPLPNNNFLKIIAENQIEIATKGALPFISAALSNSNQEIRHQAVWGIANLSPSRIFSLIFDFFQLFEKLN